MKPDLTQFAGGSHRPPTARQAAVLRVIAASIVNRGFPPTLREICDVIGIGSTNGVAEHIDCLVRKGLVTRARLVSRGLVLTPSGRAFIEALPGPAPAAAPEGGT